MSALLAKLNNNYSNLFTQSVHINIVKIKKITKRGWCHVKLLARDLALIRGRPIGLNKNPKNKLDYVSKQKRSLAKLDITRSFRFGKTDLQYNKHCI